MKTIFLTGTCFLIQLTVIAQSQGPLTAGNISNLPIPGSSSSWLNVANARVSDNQYSDFNSLPDSVGAYTDYLVATGFNFSIPAATAITGVIVEVECADPYQVSTDYKVYLYLDGTAGEDRSIKETYPPADEIRVFGGNTDLWGVAGLNYEKVNNPLFGVAIAVQRDLTGTATMARIDDIRITIYYGFMILPVQLLSFTAINSSQRVNLRWSTSGETHMQRFDVERSVDGRNFRTINSIAARNLSTNTHYSVMDNFPMQGSSFYRLKMIGISGEIKYSNIAVVHHINETSCQLYPNPVSVGEKLRIHNPGREELQITFYDLSGKLVYRLTTREQEMILRGGKLKGELAYRIENLWHTPISSGRIFIE